MTDESIRVPRETENDDANRYRRPRQPVKVRRPRRWAAALQAAGRGALVLGAGAVLIGGVYVAYRFAVASPLVTLASLETVEVEWAEHVSVEAVRENFAVDVGHTVFAVPLEERRQSLESIAWVESATLQRVLPNRLRVYLHERTPVAFLRRGNSLALIDGYGVILPLPEGASYSFPVLTGVSPALPAEQRRARMEIFREFLTELDGGEKSYSAQIAEIDLSDPNNLRATVESDGGALLLYFGRGRYREKFETYLEHRALWRASTEPVHAVDLRYRGQIVLNPDGPAGKATP